MPDLPNTSTGYLVVAVSTAQSAVPIENALVTVYAVSPNGDSKLIYTTQTNRSGQTTPLPLPAPPVGNSLSPDNPFPYSTYSVRVDFDGFYPVSSSNLTIFPNIVATLPVYLVPLDEFSTTGDDKIQNFPNHSLNNKE